MLFNGAKGIHRPSLGLNITSKHDIEIPNKGLMKNCDITRWNQRIDTKKLKDNEFVMIKLFGNV